MNASFLDVLHDAANEYVLAVGERVYVDFNRIGKIAVDQYRALARHNHGFLHVALKARRVVDDLHSTAAEYVGRPDHHRIADLLHNAPRFGGAFGDSVLRLTQFQVVEQRLEAVAVLGEVDHVGGGAENSDFCLFNRIGELQRRLAAKLHDDAMQNSVVLLTRKNFENILRGERFE